MKDAAPSEDDDYARIARAIAFLRGARGRQPQLEDVARSVNLSPFHLQRIFTRWAGISPKRLLQVLTLDFAKQWLARSADVLNASFETGLSGPSRLHDLFVSIEAMSPGEYRKAAAGLVIRYGFHPTPFGEMLIGITGRGVCFLEFLTDNTRKEMLTQMEQAWPKADLRSAPSDTGSVATAIFGRFPAPSAPLALLVRGTNFQVRVWRALLNIPDGHVASYSGIARAVGLPDSHRAVANAVGANPIAWLIPCHRVLRADGRIGGYRWGENRKDACLVWELGRYPQPESQVIH